MRIFKLNPDHSVSEIALDELAAVMAEDRSVQHTIIGAHRISTVFLALDHNYADKGPVPVLFETMIFNDVGCEAYADYQTRYSTWDDAVAGHAVAVAKVKRDMEL